jgi:hypothetical protein
MIERGNPSTGQTRVQTVALASLRKGLAAHRGDLSRPRGAPYLRLATQRLVLHHRPADAPGGLVECALQGIVVAGLEPRVHEGQDLLTPDLELVDRHPQLQ